MPPRLLPKLLAALSIALAACLPESRNPLSSPATSTIDPRLEGLYVQRREKRDDDLSTWHLHFRGARGAAGALPVTTPWLEVLNVEHVKGGGLKTNSYRALATHLGAQNYLSFIQLDAAGDKRKSPLYSFARYEVGGGGDLRIWLVSTHVLEDAIKAGKLHGEVKHQKYGDDVTLSDSTERLAAFVAASDPVALFSGPPLILYRLTR